jgi:hypothetical protein
MVVSEILNFLAARFRVALRGLLGGTDVDGENPST